MDSGYIFVSYAHKDEKAVFREISRREELGQKFWYDRNIMPGQDWTESIGKNLQGASSVLYFASKNSEKSENCRRELVYAAEHNIPVEIVNLKSNTRRILIAAAIVIAAIAFSLIRSFSGIVPDVIGEEAVSGRSAIEESGFTCSTAYGYSEEYPLGYVMEQDKTGNSLRFIPVVVTQSLGKEENLVLMPDTVGSHISDGVRMLVDSGLTKFTVSSESRGENEFGYITAQSAPAGYRISSENTINLRIAKGEEPLTFEFDGYTFTVEDGMTFDLSAPEDYGLSDAEQLLFSENNKHTIWNPENYETIWLPAQNETVIAEKPDACYGWVIVRDTEINAETLFNGYSEIYVCPGISVTINGRVTDRDGLTDFYVAKGGTLVFEDEVAGGLYLVNDGTTVFRKNVSGGEDGALIANRGDIEVSGSINEGVTVWSFYESTLSGTDNTGGTVHDYSLYRHMDASGWYEGASGSDGVGVILDKLATFETYDQSKVGRPTEDKLAIVPVIKPEDYTEHCNEKGYYVSNYLFLTDCTIDDGTETGWGFIVAPGVTLTVNKTDILASIFAEKGSTVIINGDLPAYWPYSDYMVNDGTIIINGNMNHNGLPHNYLLMNRGSLTVHGTWGGEKVYAYNFPGSSFEVDNLLEGTYVADVDFTPDYILYGNSDSHSAINYVDDVLSNQYGYPGWHNNDSD